MNNKGQVALIGLAIGIFIFLLGMTMINPIRDVIDEARGSNQLDCSNTSISDGQKMTCLAVDLTLPYFIIVIFAIAGAWITTRVI